jgi:O-antigen/teichoic acid export membrane protein
VVELDERPPAATVPVAATAGAPAGGRLVANALYRTVSDIASKLAIAVLYLVMARQLGTSGFGAFSFAFSLAVLVTTLANFGEDKLLVRSIARDPNALDRTFADTIVLQATIGVLAVAITEAVLPATGVAQKTCVVVALLGLAVVLDVVTSTHLAIFQARERMALIPAVIVPQRLGVAVVGVFALYRGVHVVGIAGIYLAGSALALPLAILLLRGEVDRPPMRLSLRRWPKLLVAALPIGVASAFATILFRVDMVMLRGYRSAHTVGTYAGAYRLFEMTLFVSAGVGASALPAFSRMKLSDDRAALGKLLRRTLLMVLIPSIPLALLFAAIPDELLHLAYGGGYGSAANALRLLAPAIVLYPISFLCGYMLVAQGRVKPLVTIYGIVAAENILANMGLIPAFSLNGAALGTSLSELLAAAGLGLVAWTQLRKHA